jgi:hypothetical protein
MHVNHASRALLKIQYVHASNLRTGCEWHTSNLTMQCPIVTIRCYPLNAGSWQVFRIVGLCVFSHQSADYSIVVAHLTSNSFVCQQEQLETVWNQRDSSQGVIKRPPLADRHRWTRLAWCLARRGWNLRTWRKIHWSDERRFRIRRPNMSQICSMGFKYGLVAGQGTEVTASLWR